MKFCRACGGEVNSRNYCSSCGKQYFSFRNKWVIASFVLALLFLFSAICNYLAYARIQSQSLSIASQASSSESLQLDLQAKTQECLDLQSDYAEALADIDDLESSLAAVKTSQGQLQSSYDKLSEQLADCEDSYYHLFDQSKELRKSIVFYNRGGAYYHALIGFCRAVDYSTFEDYLAAKNGYDPDISTLCTPDEALSRGYLPCPFCMG